MIKEQLRAIAGEQLSGVQVLRDERVIVTAHSDLGEPLVAAAQALDAESGGSRRCSLDVGSSRSVTSEPWRIAAGAERSATDTAVFAGRAGDDAGSSVIARPSSALGAHLVAGRPLRISGQSSFPGSPPARLTRRARCTGDPLWPLS